MKTTPLDIISHANIHWTRPRDYDTFLTSENPYEYEADLYMILARYSTSTIKIVYIGKTYHQGVAERLKQKDHKKRFSKLKHKFKKHNFMISCGIITFGKGENMTAKKINDIERCLIYACSTEHSINTSNTMSLGIFNSSYDIRNSGYRCGLPRRIRFGIFVS